MDWQAFATQTEADLGKADQANTELKQEVRELKKKLIAAPKTDSLQQQLTKAQQEVADYKDRYVKHLQDLQSQLAASTQAREDAEDRTAKAELASKETVKQLHALTCRFEEDQAETQKLKESLVEQEKALQQARQQHAATAQKPTAASAVSYQQHIEMLHRQLNIFKTENARLVNHSTRNKLGNGEDDSEPEYPSRQEPTKSKTLAAAAKKPPHKITLLAAKTRPASYGVAPLTKPHKAATAAVPNQNASSKPASKAQPAAPLRESAKAPFAINKKIRPDLDRAASDDEWQPTSKPKAQPKESQNLPVRSFVHESITLGHQTPQKPLVPEKTICISTPLPSSLAANATPSDKRKRSFQEPASSPKKKRNKVQEMQDELSDLAIDAIGFTAPITLRNKRRESYQEGADDSDDDESFDSSMDFNFTAICDYDDNGKIDRHYPVEDLTDCVTALWERINELLGWWEDAAGQDWQWEFKKKRKAGPAVCVNQKLQKKGTTWSGEPGKYACVDCARAGMPCFTFFKDDATGKKGEFRLLPLASKDRLKEVVPDEETRHWVNDEWPSSGKAVEKMEF